MAIYHHTMSINAGQDRRPILSWKIHPLLFVPSETILRQCRSMPVIQIERMKDLAESEKCRLVELSNPSSSSHNFLPLIWERGGKGGNGSQVDISIIS